MSEKLTDKLKSNLSLIERTQMILSLFPGIMFGFGPSNMQAMLERLDCPYCQKIVKTWEEYFLTESLLKIRIEEFQKPAQDKINRLKKIPLIGERLVKLLGLELPNPNQENWHIGFKSKLDKLMSDLDGSHLKDDRHWLDPVNIKLSKEFTSAYLKRDSWEHIEGGKKDE